MYELLLRLSDRVEGYLTANRPSLSSSFFALNPAFAVKRVLADGVPILWNTTSGENGYQTVFFYAPDCKSLTVEYDGFLDGTTGRYPYVKEKTSDDFYILRSETLYYPVFALPDSEAYLQSLLSPLERDKYRVTVEIAGARRFQTNLRKTPDGIYEGHNPTIAVGDYRLEPCPFGTIAYFGMSREALAEVRRTAAYVQDFMSRYKLARIRDFQVIEIPAGLGSFVLPGTMFFSGEPKIRQLIHEFIHTNWNPRSSGSVQRSRFFDESVTEYFTAKILEYYGLQDTVTSRAAWEAQYCSAITAYPEDEVAIADYGPRELGRLAYSFGPLALFALEEAVGEAEMTRAMSALLTQYQQEDVDFEKFRDLFPADAAPVFREYFYSTAASRWLLAGDDRPLKRGNTPL